MRARIALLASLAIFLSFSSIFCVNAWPMNISVEVPNVVGYAQADAASALVTSNLSVGTVITE